MKPFNSAGLQRRQRVQEELPDNTHPQAISGDFVEPDWEQRVTITVGPQQADLAGETDRVIQAAVDYVARGVSRTTCGWKTATFSRTGIRVGAETKAIRYEENRIEGFATDILDLRKR